jgi:hypothetical protein
MKAYKLVDQNYRRLHGNCHYPVGATVSIPEGERVSDLCQEGILHVYRHPLVAVFMDPIHANFGPSARLLEV